MSNVTVGRRCFGIYTTAAVQYQVSSRRFPSYEVPDTAQDGNIR